MLKPIPRKRLTEAITGHRQDEAIFLNEGQLDLGHRTRFTKRKQIDFASSMSGKEIQKTEIIIAPDATKTGHGMMQWQKKHE